MPYLNRAFFFFLSKIRYLDHGFWDYGSKLPVKQAVQPDFGIRITVVKWEGQNRRD